MHVGALGLVLSVLRKEAIQQLHPAGFILGQLVNLVLPINVDARQQVAREKGRDVAIHVTHHRRLAMTTRNGVLLAVLGRGHHCQLNPTGRATKVLLDDLLVELLRLLAFGWQVQGEAQAFEQG